MSAVLEIPINAISFSQLLSLVDSEGSGLVWSILDWEAVGDITNIWPDGMLALEQRVADSPQGVILTWSNLRQLIETVDQVINGILIACQTQAQIPSLTPGLSVHETGDIVIEAFDSSIWRVSAKDPSILHKLIDANSLLTAA